MDGAPPSVLARAHELAWIAENLCALHGIRILRSGDLPSERCVLVANHINYFDPLVLASQVPLSVVAKREVRDWPAIGDVCRRLGVLFVDRADSMSGAQVLRDARTLLQQDVPVLIFPEGTTTQGDVVLPFKRGIFGVAAQLGVPVVPVALRYEREDVAWVGDATFLPHYVRSMKHPCTRVGVQFLDPILPTPGMGAARLAERARRAIAGALGCAPRTTWTPPSVVEEGRLVAIG